MQRWGQPAEREWRVCNSGRRPRCAEACQSACLRPGSGHSGRFRACVRCWGGLGRAPGGRRNFTRAILVPRGWRIVAYASVSFRARGWGSVRRGYGRLEVWAGGMGGMLQGGRRHGAAGGGCRAGHENAWYVQAARDCGFLRLARRVRSGPGVPTSSPACSACGSVCYDFRALGLAGPAASSGRGGCGLRGLGGVSRSRRFARGVRPSCPVSAAGPTSR